MGIRRIKSRLDFVTTNSNLRAVFYYFCGLHMDINCKDIEKKRQQKRTSEQIYKVSEDPNKEKFYILDMFPYPSGAGLHVGHPKGYVASDTLARKKMLEGFSVLHPMGFDTFGVAAEQYAIDHKMKPQIVAEKNIAYYKQQLEGI